MNCAHQAPLQCTRRQSGSSIVNHSCRPEERHFCEISEKASRQYVHCEPTLSTGEHWLLPNNTYEKQAYLLWQKDHAKAFRSKKEHPSYDSSFSRYLSLAIQKLDGQVLAARAYELYLTEREPFLHLPLKKRPAWFRLPYNKEHYLLKIQEQAALEELNEQPEVEEDSGETPRKKRKQAESFSETPDTVPTSPDNRDQATSEETSKSIPETVEHIFKNLGFTVINLDHIFTNRARAPENAAPEGNDPPAATEEPPPPPTVEQVVTPPEVESEKPKGPTGESLPTQVEPLSDLEQHTRTGLDLLAAAASDKQPEAVATTPTVVVTVRRDDTFGFLDKFLKQVCAPTTDSRFTNAQYQHIPLTRVVQPNGRGTNFHINGRLRARIATKGDLEHGIEQFSTVLKEFFKKPSDFIEKARFTAILRDIGKQWISRFRALSNLNDVPFGEHLQAHNNILTIPITAEQTSRTGHLLTYLAARIGLAKPQQATRSFVNLFVLQIVAIDDNIFPVLDFSRLYNNDWNDSISEIIYPPRVKELAKDLEPILPLTITRDGTTDDFTSLALYHHSHLTTSYTSSIDQWLESRVWEIEHTSPQLKFASDPSGKRRKARLAAARALWATDRAFYASLDPEVTLHRQVYHFDEPFYLGVVIKREDAERRAHFTDHARFTAYARRRFSDESALETPAPPDSLVEPQPSAKASETFSSEVSERSPLVLTIRLPQPKETPVSAASTFEQLKELEKQKAKAKEEERAKHIPTPVQPQQGKTPPKPKRGRRKNASSFPN